MVLLLRETNKNHQNKKITQQDIILQTKLGLKKRKSQKTMWQYIILRFF